MSESLMVLSWKFLSGQTIRRGSSLVALPMGKTAVQCCHCLQICAYFDQCAREI